MPPIKKSTAFRLRSLAALAGKFRYSPNSVVEIRGGENPSISVADESYAVTRFVPLDNADELKDEPLHIEADWIKRNVPDGRVTLKTDAHMLRVNDPRREGVTASAAHVKSAIFPDLKLVMPRRKKGRSVLIDALKLAKVLQAMVDATPVGDLSDRVVRVQIPEDGDNMPLRLDGPSTVAAFMPVNYKDDDDDQDGEEG